MIHLYFYFDGDISNELRQSCCFIAKDTAHYSMKNVTEEVFRHDYPQQLPEHSHWIFRRHEDLEMKTIDSNDYDGMSLSVGYALLGKITTAVRSVGLSMDINNDESATLFFCINGPIDEHITALCESVAHCTRDLNPDFQIRTKIYRLDLPIALAKDPDLH